MNSEPSYKNCTKRSIVYETWCNSCKKKMENSENEKENGEKNKRKRSGELVNEFTYIGETSRSAWERAEEHWKDLEYRRPKSHILKHIVEHHPYEDPSNVDFRIKILSSHNSAFERQIREAVLIEKLDGPYSLNSKLEYSRTIIPKIKMKMGHRTEEESPEIKKEKEIVEKVKLLHEEFNKTKRNSNMKTDKRIVKRIKLEACSHQSKPKDIPELIESSDLSNIESSNSPKSSDFSNIVKENCSKVSNSNNLESSDFSNIAKENCSKVSSEQSDFSNIATENCSKVSNSNNLESSDFSNIATENCSKVSRKVKIIEDKNCKIRSKVS